MHRANRIKTSWQPQRFARNVAALRRAVDNGLESLESRRLFAVTASAAGGVLTVTGDNNANAITVSRDVTGNLRVNNGAVAITGQAANVTTIQTINVLGRDGNDNISLDETNGALPNASLRGGNGNDTLTGGSGADTLKGDVGNDALFGKAGNDSLLGGVGNDTLTGGIGADQALGEAGDDRMIWNPGEGSDTNEGGDGNDTVEVNGADVNETFSADLVAGRVSFKRTDPGPFSIDIGTSEKLELNAKGGNDTFNGGVGLAGVIAVRVDGGAGNDTLLGTDGNDTLLGGDGSDFIDGNKGADVAFLGAGDDFFRWDPGDGSDTVEGQAGADRMIFNGNDLAEKFDLSAHDGRFRLFRDLGTITMDTNDVEAIELNALGGADSITIHDLRFSDVTKVDLGLAATGGASDGAIDDVTVRGTSNRDIVRISGGAGSAVALDGLAAKISISGQDSTDLLHVNTNEGSDVIDASNLQANTMLFTADGGTGNDIIVGSAGNDTIFGGDGSDVLIGGPGADQLIGGPDFDIVIQ